MRKLLADNISILNQLEAMQGFPPLQLLGAARSRLQEVTSLSTGCYCFLGYMAILMSDPTRKTSSQRATTGTTTIMPLLDQSQKNPKQMILPIEDSCFQLSKSATNKSISTHYTTGDQNPL